MKTVRITFIPLFLLLLMACTPGEHQDPMLEYMPDMTDSPAVKAQEALMRVPVKGTRPIDFTPYAFTAEQGEMAGASLQNPYPMTREILQEGQKTFNTFCIVCHGPAGKGNGPIIPKFPMPPTLNSDKVRQWPDGRIFHAMTRGQNLMPSYASQINPQERWAVVGYLRVLQRSVNPTPEDVEAFEKALGGNP